MAERNLYLLVHDGDHVLAARPAEGPEHLDSVMAPWAACCEAFGVHLSDYDRDELATITAYCVPDELAADSTDPRSNLYCDGFGGATAWSKLEAYL